MSRQLQNNTINDAMSITTNCLINQVTYFLANCFFFRTKFWMLQVIKSDSCRILAIFFQCCFMIETQVLMTVSNFSGIFSRNHFLEGGFTFQWGRGGVPILIGGFKENCRMGGGGYPTCSPPSPLWETLGLYTAPTMLWKVSDFQLLCTATMC